MQEHYLPGMYIHLWHTDAGWSTTYMPFNFFDEVEFLKMLINDHLFSLDIIQYF